jgi:DNA-binding NarL/FixJ family response regulator
MKILVVDDHPLIREGLCQVLAELDEHVDVLQADSAEPALAALQSHPDLGLILLDLGLPAVDGLTLLKQIREDYPDTPLVVLSANDARSVVLESLDAGAMGFISKRSPTPMLVNALRVVLAGGVCVPRQVLASPGAAPPAANPLPDRQQATLDQMGITPRQAEVLALLVQGKPTKIICRELQLSESTVKSHIAAILRAFNVSNRTQALFELSRLGIVLPLLPGSRPSTASSS